MIQQHPSINFERLKKMIDKSAEIGAIPKDGLCRLALTETDKEMREIFAGWMNEANLAVRLDDFGNMYGSRKGRSDIAPVSVGSHLDTQPNGGRFDGVLGVLTALEVIHTLNDHGVETERPIEIVNFTNEEGARFEPPLLGSGGLAGVFDKDFVYSRKDRYGISFEEELINKSLQGDRGNRIKAIHSFIELHIEQGPVLENEQIEIGAVEGIKGMTWLEINVTGEGGHAGPTPMPLRKDALLAAAKIILQIEEKANLVGPELSVTIGRMAVKPDVINCIPEEVIFSLDVRHMDDTVRERFMKETLNEIQSTSREHHVQLTIDTLWEVKTTHFHPQMIDQIASSAAKLGYSLKRMYSGAGHDAKYISRIAPTGMIFLPSIGGKSHVESELTLDKDIEKGANVLLESIVQLANTGIDLYHFNS